MSTKGAGFMNLNRLLASVVTLTVLAVLTPARADAQALYYDAWSSDNELSEEDPTAWYWGYGSTTWSGCPGTGGANCDPLEAQTMSRGKNPSNAVIAEQWGYGSSYSSSTVQPTAGPTSPDGQYPFDTYHSIRYLRFEGGVYEENFDWWEFFVQQIDFAGINNRYKFDHQEADRWVFVRDECHATCQNDSQYLNYDPGIASGYTFLHRKVRRVSIFGIGKCFRARLTPRNYRGACTT
jgi:hypothetical protein